MYPGKELGARFSASAAFGDDRGAERPEKAPLTPTGMPISGGESDRPNCYLRNLPCTHVTCAFQKRLIDSRQFKAPAFQGFGNGFTAPGEKEAGWRLPFSLQRMYPRVLEVW
jgi:hypothetical protein